MPGIEEDEQGEPTPETIDGDMFEEDFDPATGGEGSNGGDSDSAFAGSDYAEIGGYDTAKSEPAIPPGCFLGPAVPLVPFRKPARPKGLAMSVSPGSEVGTVAYNPQALRVVTTPRRKLPFAPQEPTIPPPLAVPTSVGSPPPSAPISKVSPPTALACSTSVGSELPASANLAPADGGSDAGSVTGMPPSKRGRTGGAPAPVKKSLPYGAYLATFSTFPAICEDIQTMWQVRGVMRECAEATYNQLYKVRGLLFIQTFQSFRVRLTVRSSIHDSMSILWPLPFGL